MTSVDPELRNLLQMVKILPGALGPAAALYWLMKQESFVQVRRTESGFYQAQWGANHGSGDTAWLAVADAIRMSE